MGRVLSLLYGGLAYVLFLGVFLYAIGFVGDFAVPRTVDAGPATATGTAILIDALLLLLFAVQHSVMARRWFKERWTRIVPQHLERSTYVLFTSLVLAFLYWQWRPIPDVVWSVEGAGATLLWAVFGLGWVVVLVTTFLIDHFDLFGLRHVWLHFQGREYTPLEFQEPGFYQYVRHPLYLGFLMAFWAIPEMTAGHLLFAVATTGYVLMAIQFEESDLLRYHGEAYAEYRERVPMLLPIGGGSGDGGAQPAPGSADAGPRPGGGEPEAGPGSEEPGREPEAGPRSGEPGRGPEGGGPGSGPGPEDDEAGPGPGQGDPHRPSGEGPRAT